MTAEVFGEDTSGRAVDPYSPEHVAPLVAYLASPAAERITGQVFVVYGGMVAVVAAPGRRAALRRVRRRLDLDDLDKQLGGFFADRDPSVGFAADSIMRLDGLRGTAMGRLDGKVAIVTGGARARAPRSAAPTWPRAPRSSSPTSPRSAGEALADELGDGAHFAAPRRQRRASWTTLVEVDERAVRPGQRARQQRRHPAVRRIEQMPLEEVELLFRVNQLGCFLGMQAVVPTMEGNGGGSIINASSIEGLGGMADTGGLRLDQVRDPRHDQGRRRWSSGRKGIRVNSVHPGMIDTPMTRVHGGDAAMEFGATKVPLRRVGYPEDIAPLYVFLASDESSYINGAEIAIDGGVTATHALRRLTADSTARVSRGGAGGPRSPCAGRPRGGGAAGDPGHQRGEPDVADHPGDRDVLVGDLAGALGVHGAGDMRGQRHADRVDLVGDGGVGEHERAGQRLGELRVALHAAGGRFST